jgi:O-antigen/teichoic acid export membrane protein
MNLAKNDQEPSLLTTATRGVAWSLSAGIGVMAISLAAQILLGWLLTDHDFGVYAYAVAFYHIFRVCTDGGVGLWLARLSKEEYDRDCGHAFWLASGLSILLGGVVALIARPVSVLYAEPQVAQLLWILAATLPFNALRVVLLPGLQVHLRFQTLATVKFVSALVRYSLVVGLAFAGWGPFSFVIPIAVITLLENVVYLLSLKIPVWRTRFRWSECRRILSESCWSLAGTLPEAVSTQIDYAVLGLVVSTEVVGVYFFAYQLTIQMVMLFSESLRRVILPVFARVESGSEGESRGLGLSASFLGVVAAPAMLLFAAVAEPLEAILWHGRWEPAVVPMQLLAAVMPLHLVSIYAEMLTQSRGRFRMWAAAVLLRGLGFGMAAFVAGTWTGGAITDVTRWLAAFIGVASIIELIVLFRGNLLGWPTFLGRFLPPYVISAGLAVAVIYLIPSTPNPFMTLAARGAAFAAVAVVLFKLLFSHSVDNVLATLLRIRDRSAT